jgi:hypothetical protein
MPATAHPTPSSAAAHVPASRPLELLEARQLRDALKNLLRREQAVMADFLIALADFDRRRGWEALGHANLFALMRVELGLCRSGSYWRLSAARLVQRFPEVIEPLRDGRLCMSTTAELAKVLTEENRAEVLPRYFGLSAREAQEVTAELAPRQTPPARDFVTRLGRDRTPQLVVRPVVAPVPSPDAVAVPVAVTVPVAMPSPVALAAAGLTGESVQTFGLLPADHGRGAAPPTRDDVEPLSAELRRLHITVSREFLRELERARDGLSHAIPNAATEQVLQAGLRILLEKQARARGQVRRPRTAPAENPTGLPATQPGPPLQPAPRTPPAPRTQAARAAQATMAMPRTSPAPPPRPQTERPPRRRPGVREAIPAAVRRAVWARDQGRCQWPLDGGGCCGSTHRLELDHIIPWAEWGPSTVENLRVVCRRHNALAARRVFGERVVGRYAGRALAW